MESIRVILSESNFAEPVVSVTAGEVPPPQPDPEPEPEPEPPTKPGKGWGRNKPKKPR